MIFYPLALISGIGLVCALIADGSLIATSKDGVPHWVPAVGGAGLLAVALVMRWRAELDGADRDFWRALSLTWASGAACASMVPIRSLAKRLESGGVDSWLEVAHGGLLLIFAYHLIRWTPRALVALWRGARRRTRGQVRSAAAAGVVAIALVVGIIGLDESGALPISASVATVICYAWAITAGAMMLAQLKTR